MFALRMLWRKLEWLVCVWCIGNVPLWQATSNSIHIPGKKSTTQNWWPCKTTVFNLHFLFSQNKPHNHSFHLFFRTLIIARWVMLFLWLSMVPGPGGPHSSAPLCATTFLSCLSTDLDGTSLLVRCMSKWCRVEYFRLFSFTGSYPHAVTFLACYDLG